ncbi:MAG: hypothetical protein GXP38_15420 [Chloroflexi bacterium]|nr:hypothetical protein [Chloroflexota bacterium]
MNYLGADNWDAETDMFSVFLWMLFVVITLTGIFLFLVPNSLSSNSPMYRWIYYRYFAWSKEDMENAPKFSKKRVRIFAAITFFVGIVGTAIWSIDLFF